MNILGQYFPNDSFWHRTDPRSKFSLTVAIMVGLTSNQHFEVLCLGLLVGCLYFQSEIPLTVSWRGLARFKWLLLITLLVNLLFPWHSAKTILINLSPALFVSLKLTLILLTAAWLSYVTKPLNLIEGIALILRPLTKLNPKFNELPLMIGLVIRFIPDLITETENIIIAQRIRGVQPGYHWQKGGLWVRSTIIPIFLASIRKSAAVAVAMEARGYQPGKPRSSMVTLVLKPADYLIILLSISILITLLII